MRGKVYGRAKKKSIDALRAWLGKKDDYTLHRPVRKNFALNPYTVRSVMDVWGCHMMDAQAYAKCNDNHKYILSVINVFSNFSTNGPFKDKVRTFRCLGVSVHIR